MRSYRDRDIIFFFAVTINLTPAISEVKEHFGFENEYLKIRDKIDLKRKKA